jgi:hypothetical protein
MSDQVFLLLLLGGLGAIGVVVLVSGLFAAQRKASVIWCAVAATLLFSAEVGMLIFARWVLKPFSESGNPIAVSTIGWLGAAGAALVIGFLAFKPSRVRR